MSTITPNSFDDLEKMELAQNALPIGPFSISVPDFSGDSEGKHKKGKKGKKGKKKKREESIQNELMRTRHRSELLAYQCGRLDYENEMLRKMMRLALAASQGKLNEEALSAGFQLLP